MISTAELADKKFKGVTLPSYGRMLGKIPENATGVIWGKKGSGKSTLAVDLAYVMAHEFGKGIYCSSEEGPGPSMQSKINRLKAEHDELMVTDFDGLDDLKAAIRYSRAKFAILDSASMSYVKMSEFEDFHNWCKSEGVILFYILHANKEGNFKGNTLFVHLPDIEIKVEDGRAFTEKNRFEETPREMEVVFEREAQGKSEKAKGRDESHSSERENPDFDADIPEVSEIQEEFYEWAYEVRDITPKPATLKTWLSENYAELTEDYQEIWDQFGRENPDRKFSKGDRVEWEKESRIGPLGIQTSHSGKVSHYRDDGRVLVIRDMPGHAAGYKLPVEENLLKKERENPDLRGVKITYEDGDTTHTSVSGDLTDQEIREYYKVGKTVNVSIGPEDNKKRISSVEILDPEIDRSNPATDTACLVNTRAQTNEEKNGIEIQFSDAPPKFIRDGLKDHDFTYYAPKDGESFWAAKKTPERKAFIESIAGEFDSAVLGWKEKEGKSEKAKGKSEEAESRDESHSSEPSKSEDEPAVVGTSQSKIRRPLGDETTVDFKADGSIQVEGYYTLIQQDELEASHNKDCSPNSNHKISKGQPRDRSVDALCQQPKFIAQNLNPASITQGNLAFNGAPIVLPDGQVIQGNGRTIALKISYDEHPENAKQYKDYLINNATEFGIEKGRVKRIDQPVLVRVLDVSDERAVELGNVVDTSQAKMSKIDQGKAYIRNLTEAEKQAIGGMFEHSGGETIGEVIDDVGLRIMGQFEDLDRQGLVEDNSLTSEGKDFLRSVFAGLVFDSDENKQALQHFLNLKHTQKAGLERSYGNIIPFVGTKADITPKIQKAVEISAQVQQTGGIDTVKDFMSQSDAFEGANAERFTEQEAKMAEFFLDVNTQKAIRNVFRMYQWKVNGKEDLFNPIEKVSPDKAFDAAFVEKERVNPTRVNPTDPLIYIGSTEQLNVDTGNEILGLKGDYPTFVSDNRLYIIPGHRIKTVKNKVDDEDAIKGFEEWHHYEADEVDMEIDWPQDKTRPAGTAKEIWYSSDKIMREGDTKGEMNHYVHEFDAGKRPVVVKDNIVIVGNIEWNERGLLN